MNPSNGRRRAYLLAAIAIGVVGCGGNGGILGGEISCTQSVAGAPELTICREATGLSTAEVEAFQETCVVAEGILGASATFREAPCSRDDALGACRTLTGTVTTTIWYYNDGLTSPSDIRELCGGIKATFVAP